MCKCNPLLCPGIEQFTRYFYMAGEQDFAPFTKENTVEDPDEEEVEDKKEARRPLLEEDLDQDVV